jgi:hypothetical protein
VTPVFLQPAPSLCQCRKEILAATPSKTPAPIPLRTNPRHRGRLLTTLRLLTNPLAQKIMILMVASNKVVAQLKTQLKTTDIGPNLAKTKLVQNVSNLDPRINKNDPTKILFSVKFKPTKLYNSPYLDPAFKPSPDKVNLSMDLKLLFALSLRTAYKGSW